MTPLDTIVRMDDASFERLSSFVTREYGIKLPVEKKPMLESRLNKKLKSLGLNSYKEFLDFLFSSKGMEAELTNVIDLITTNKTDFFREPAHFSFLSNDYLPQLCTGPGSKKIKIWSAGCSSGEEPYTLVMVMEEFRRRHLQFSYDLIASDISTRVLQSAYQGVYEIEKVNPVPLEMKRMYLMRSKTDPNVVRIKPEYRTKIQFKRINFMDAKFGLPKAEFDVIFCRNVLIYFDKATQERVINKFCSHLKPGGILFLGHSESIIGLNVPLKQIRPTVYRFEG